MSSDGAERRRSFRVTESVHLKYEILSEVEFEEGIDSRRLRMGSTNGVRSRLLDLDLRLREELIKLKGDSVLVASCLGLLNQKLNSVIDQLPAMQKTNSALASQPIRTCNISADGMVFGCDRTFDPGTKLSMRFIIASDHRYLETFAEVIRMVEPPEAEAEGRRHGVAVEFHGMQEVEREMLIRHLFNRECETLRMRRLRLDDESSASAGEAQGADSYARSFPIIDESAQ